MSKTKDIKSALRFVRALFQCYSAGDLDGPAVHECLLALSRKSNQHVDLWQRAFHGTAIFLVDDLWKLCCDGWSEELSQLGSTVCKTFSNILVFQILEQEFSREKWSDFQRRNFLVMITNSYIFSNLDGLIDQDIQRFDLEKVAIKESIFVKFLIESAHLDFYSINDAPNMMDPEVKDGLLAFFIDLFSSWGEIDFAEWAMRDMAEGKITNPNFTPLVSMSQAMSIREDILQEFYRFCFHYWRKKANVAPFNASKRKDNARRKIGFLTSYLDYGQMAGVSNAAHKLMSNCTEFDIAMIREADIQSKTSDQEKTQHLRDMDFDMVVCLDQSTSMFGRLILNRVATVQVSWIHTMWYSDPEAIDWVITDMLLDCDGPNKCILPGGAVIFEPDKILKSRPCVSRGRNGRPFTFISGNRASKISERSILSWKRIIDRVEGSRLILCSRDYAKFAYVESMWKLLRAAGFDKSQVEIYGEQTSGARWDLVDQCDIWLDSFPFNGGVSYAEALWSGIPAPCFPDSCARGRIAASHAYFSNLADDLLAPNQQAWEDLCVALAHDDDRRLRIAGSQRAKMAASPFCDADRLALELEDGLRMIIEESFGRR